MMIKKYFFLLLLVISVITNAQDKEPDNRPVRSPFDASILIDNQTIIQPYKRGLDFTIHHRFGTVENGISDLYGIYAASNIRMGLDFGITDKIMVGIGTEKDGKLQDIQWKYSILQQTRSGSVPVAVSYFGNFVLDMSDSSGFRFGHPAEYKAIHRLSYFNQIIIARKFNKKLSLQLAPSVIYYNAVMPNVNNLHFGISAGGRYKITDVFSIIAEYDKLLTKNEAKEAKPNIAAGFEISTPTHAFRLFAASYKNIINQRNLVYNTNDFLKGDILLGFNITVRFSL